MNKLELTVAELRNIVANNEIVGRGTYGIVYKLSDNILFKFRYKDFISFFERKDRKIDLRKLSDISESIDGFRDAVYSDDNIPGLDRNVERTINIKDEVKLTKLTQGYVCVNGLCVGYLLYNHKNMVKLFDYLNDNKPSQDEKILIFGNIKKAVDELMQHNIYTQDLSTTNVLINPKNKKIQLIDFEDCMTESRENCPDYIIDNVQRRMNIIENCLLTKKEKEL